MPPEPQAVPVDPSELALREELRRYGDELAQDAIDPLIGLWAPKLAGLSHDVVAERVAEWLEEPEIAVWAKNYKRPGPAGAQGPLRVVLGRHAEGLLPGAIEVLFRAWGFELNSLPLPTIAGEVARRLASPEAAAYLRTADASSRPEQAVRAVLAKFAGDLIPGAVDELSRRWGPELAKLSATHLIVEAVAQRLSQPAFLGFLKPGRSMPRTGSEALQAALARRDDLRPRAAGELLRLWAPLMGHLPPARVAGLVEQRLASPAGAAYLRG